MLAAALLAAAALLQQVVTAPPSSAREALAGPLDFCAEDFSVRLERGERAEWRALPSGSIRYSIESGDFSADVTRFGGGRRMAPAAELTALSLPLSPVSRRRSFAMPELAIADANGATRPLVIFGIEYLLHGQAETEAPISVLGFHDDRDARFPFVQRIDPRPLAERRCTPSRTDPALAGRIVRIPAGR